MRNQRVSLQTLEASIICHVKPSYNELLIYTRSLTGRTYILRIYDDCGKIKTDSIMETNGNEGNQDSTD